MFGQLLTGLTWQELAGEQGAGGMRGPTARKAAWLFPLACRLKPQACSGCLVLARRAALLCRSA